MPVAGDPFRIIDASPASHQKIRQQVLDWPSLSADRQSSVQKLAQWRHRDEQTECERLNLNP
jgi:hypothetical protein